MYMASWRGALVYLAQQLCTFQGTSKSERDSINIQQARFLVICYCVLGHLMVRGNTLSGSENERFRTENRFANLTDPKLLMFQACIFGYRLRVDPHPEMCAQFRVKSCLKMASGFDFPHVKGGNTRVSSRKPKTAVVTAVVTLLVQNTRHASDVVSAEQATHIIGMLVLLLLLLLCSATHWHTPRASPRADEIE